MDAKDLIRRHSSMRSVDIGYLQDHSKKIYIYIYIHSLIISMCERGFPDLVIWGVEYIAFIGKTSRPELLP